MPTRSLLHTALISFACITSATFLSAAPIHDAVLAGKIDAVRSLLQANANLVDSPDVERSGNLPLMLAASSGKTEIVQFLLDQGATVDARRPDNATALMCAAEQGHADIAKLLIDRNAAVNTQNNRSATPLILAAQGGHVDVARVLLTKTLTIDSQRDDGATALLCAVRTGNLALVKLLIDWKALGIDPVNATIEAKDIRNFQPAHVFRVDEAIPVEKGKGWLLVVK